MAENIFEKVLENVDIADVVSNYVELIPKGKNLFGICPFHDDTNPSMSVSREKGIFYCFVCKKGGNAIKFVEEYKHISSIDAARDLANTYHIDVSEFNNEKTDKTRRYFDLMQTSHKFFKFLMNDENYSKEARNYLSNRGINNEVIESFGLGLAPDDDKALLTQLTSKGFLIPDIELNGLSNGSTDTFVSRIIVPIRDEQGRVVAFGGRIYREKDKGLNKYLNSKETPLFKKGELVFNLDKASQSLKTKKYLILNEGYMDVITAVSNGFDNSIALMGTSMTHEQALLIAKYTKNVAICLDGDAPGVKGVKSVTDRLKEVGINYSITILPEDMDPDEYIRTYGRDAYLDYIENKKLDKAGYLYYLTKLDYPVINTFNTDTFKNAIFNNLKEEKERSLIEMYLNKLSVDLKVSYSSILQDYDSYMTRIDPLYKKMSTEVRQEGFNVISGYTKAEHMMVDYALKSSVYYRYIESKMESRVFMKDQSYRNLFIEIGDIYDTNRGIPTDDLITELKRRGTYKDFKFDSKISFSESDIDTLLKTFEKEEIKELLEIKKEKLAKTETTSDEKTKLVKEITELKRRLKK